MISATLQRHNVYIKTHVARQIVRSLGNIPSIVILSQASTAIDPCWSILSEVQDSFYKRHTPEEIALANASLFDFDHPDAIDMPMFAAVCLTKRTKNGADSIQCLADLKACRQSNIPVYSFAQHQRLAETKYLYGASVIISTWSKQVSVARV